jgi:hypothetical protein
MPLVGLMINDYYMILGYKVDFSLDYQLKP